MRNIRGNALVEFVLSLFLFIPVFAFGLSLGLFFLSAIRAQSLARFGTCLQTSGFFSDALIESEVKAYQTRLSLLKLGKIERGDFRDFPGASFYDFASTKIRLPVFHNSSLTIEVVSQKSPHD